MVHGFLLRWLLLCRAWALGAQPSVAVTHRFSSPSTCGIFPDQGSNLCLLHRQADSYPLRSQGRPWGCIVSHALYILLCSTVKAPREVHVSEVTENSAKLHWERPEPPSPYLYNLTVTSAQDQAVVLKQNLSVTDHVIGGLLPGQTYHITVICSLRSQVRAIYQGSFSTSKCTVASKESWYPSLHRISEPGGQGNSSHSWTLS